MHATQRLSGTVWTAQKLLVIKDGNILTTCKLTLTLPKNYWVILLESGNCAFLSVYHSYNTRS